MPNMEIASEGEASSLSEVDARDGRSSRLFSHPDDAALGVQPRHLQLFHVKHFDVGGQLATVRRRASCPSSPARRPPGASSCCDQSTKSGKRGEGARADQRRSCRPAIRPGRAGRAGSAAAVRPPPAGRTPPSWPTASRQSPRCPARRIAITTPGKPGAGTDIEQAAPAPATRAASGAMTARLSSRWWVSIARRIAQRRQVVDLVPFQDQRAVGQQLLASAASSRPSPSVAAPSRSSPHPAAHSPACCGSADGVLREGAVPALAQMDHQQRDRRRRHARNARGQAQRFRPMLGQLLPHFEAQRRHLHVVQVGRQLEVLEMRGALHLVVLAVDVAGVLGGDLDLLDLQSVAQRTCASPAAYLPPSSDISAA